MHSFQRAERLRREQRVGLAALAQPGRDALTVDQSRSLVDKLAAEAGTHAVDELVAAAEQHRREGRLQEAEAHYQQILQLEPKVRFPP